MHLERCGRGVELGRELWHIEPQEARAEPQEAAQLTLERNELAWSQGPHARKEETEGGHLRCMHFLAEAAQQAIAMTGRSHKQ